MNLYSTNRRYDIDWLRNMGILLLFPFHSARVFDHWEGFYIKSAELSWGFSWFVALADYWFMPLLFWLAGSSSWYALESRSLNEYVKERFSRLLIPFVFGLLVIVPPQGYYAKMSLGKETSYWEHIQAFFTDFHDLSGYTGGFSPTHLWFILYLFVISLAAAPLLALLKKQQAKPVLERFANTFSHPVSFVLLSIPLTISLALPAPGGKNPFFFLFVFLLGYLVSANIRFQQMFDRYKRIALALAAVTTSVWAVLGSIENDSLIWSIMLQFLQNVCMLVTLTVILGYGNKYLNVRSRWVSYCNRASFPVYILHQTVLVAVGYYILKWPIGIYLQFFLIMALSLIVSTAAYEFLINRSVFLQRLFGLKPRKSSKA